MPKATGPSRTGHRKPFAHYQQLYDKAWLQEHYMQPGVTYDDVARLVGCHPNTVMQRVRVEGFPSPKARDRQLARTAQPVEPEELEDVPLEPVVDCYNCERHLCNGCPLIRDMAHGLALRLMGQTVPMEL